MDKSYLKYYFFISMCFFAQVVKGQVRIDTIGSEYTSFYEERRYFYKVVDNFEKETLIEIENRNRDPKRAECLKNPKCNSYWYKIRYDEKYISKSVQEMSLTGYPKKRSPYRLSTPDFDPICQDTFKRIYAKYQDKYLVTKNDSCFFLLENCRLEFLLELGESARILIPSNPDCFLLHDEKSAILHLYNSDGTKSGQIENQPKFHYKSRSNYFLVNVYDEFGEKIKRGQYYQVYDYNGNLVMKASDIKGTEGFAIFKDLEGRQSYFFEGEKTTIPEDVEKVRPLPTNHLEVELSNGNFGIFSNSFKDTIIPPLYKYIGFTYVQKKPIYYAKDHENKITIFDHLGNPKKLGIVLKKSGNFFKFLIKMGELKNGIKFIVVRMNDSTYHILDENWKFLATEFINKADPYCLNLGRSNTDLFVPRKILRHFSEKINKNDFFKIWDKSNDLGGIILQDDKYNLKILNLIDSDLEIVFPENFVHLKRLNTDHYMIGAFRRPVYGKKRKGEKFIVKLEK